MSSEKPPYDKKGKQQQLEEMQDALRKLEEEKEKSDAELKKAIDEKLAGLGSSKTEDKKEDDHKEGATTEEVKTEEELVKPISLEDEETENKEPTLEEKVDKAREKYLAALDKYNKERGAWRKVITTLGINENYKNSKLAEVEKVKSEYDQSRVELGKKMSNDKKAELERMGLPGEELNKQLFEYRNNEIFKRIHIDEYQKLQEKRAEKLPPDRKTLLKKAWGLSWKYAQMYSDLGKKGKTLFEIPIPKSGGKTFKVTTGFLAKSLVTSAFFTATAGGGAVMFGTKLARGLTSGITSGVANKIIKNKQEKNLDKFKIDIQNQKSTLQKQFSLGNISLANYEKTFAEIEKVVERKKRIQMAKRAGASILVGMGTSYASASVSNIMDSKAHALDEVVSKEHSGGNITTDTNTIETPKAPESAPATSSIPKEALIDAKHNVGITYAFKSQLEANSELAQKLGYDVAPNKAQFLADLAKKLGYIKEGGEVGVYANMNSAYVLEVDGAGNPIVQEYQNGVLSDTVHKVGEEFENDTEKYEYFHKTGQGKVEVGGTNPVEKTNSNDGYINISEDPTKGSAANTISTNNAENVVTKNESGYININEDPTKGVVKSGDHTFTPTKGSNGELPTMNNTGDILNTGGPDKDIYGNTINTDGKQNVTDSTVGGNGNTINHKIDTTNSNPTVNIESTEQFINTKTTILDKDFGRLFTRGSTSKEWIHIRNTSMDELSKTDHVFASNSEAKGVAKLLSEAKSSGIDYHGKTADQLVNELTKKRLGK